MRRLLDLVRDDLGDIYYVLSNRLSLGKVRREENILWSFAPHDVAAILRIVGSTPIEVTALGGAYLQPGIADVTLTSMLFQGASNGGFRFSIVANMSKKTSSSTSSSL